ncbi:MAG: hypothetical protein CME60_05795 [Halobacteriovoraceae bacterium]|nr:hypothetical protein [Halobacteriovoraceae bacterium]
MFTSDAYSGLRKSVLGRKLLFSILLFSTIVTLFLTSFQIYLDYKQGIDGIYDRIDQIRLTQLESLAQNVWNINNDQIRIQLKGLLEIKSIKKLQIISPDNENISISKDTQIDDPIVTRMPLIYKIKEKEVDLGILEIVSDKSHVLKELQSKIFIILLTQAMKTFLVSLFILFIYNVLVNRHIIQINAFARELSLENIGRRLKLHRGENEDHDELDDLADSFNLMQEKFSKEMEQRKEFEKQLRQSQKMEALGTLASGIAHDFNNILQGLYNALFLLEEEVIDNAEALDKLETANGLTDRARELVKQILIFTRQEEGTFDKFSPIPPIQDVVEILRAASNNKVSIDFIVDPPEGKLYGDQTQLKQVILNIGNNAIQAVEDREHPKVIIKVSPMEIVSKTDLNLAPGPYLKIEVIDNGQGIKEDIIDRVFEPFFTTKEVGKGTGLGLSVVHGIVQRHKGEIKIDSIPGQSTHFCVYLPLFMGNGNNQNYEYTGKEDIFLLSSDRELITQYLLSLEYMNHRPQICEDFEALVYELKQALGPYEENTSTLFPIVIIDEKDRDLLEERVAILREISPYIPVIFLVNDLENSPERIEELSAIVLKRSKNTSEHNNNDMAMILLTRELKYSMEIAKKALSKAT